MCWGFYGLPPNLAAMSDSFVSCIFFSAALCACNIVVFPVLCFPGICLVLLMLFVIPQLQELAIKDDQ